MFEKDQDEILEADEKDEINTPFLPALGRGPVGFKAAIIRKNMPH